MTTTADRWERFLDPEVVRPSLFLATMYITTFEILKDSVVDRNWPARRYNAQARRGLTSALDGTTPTSPVLANA